MAVAALPLNLTPPSSSPAPTSAPAPATATGEQPLDAAQPGAAKGVDLFAALLATQVGLGVKKAPAPAATDKPVGAEPAKALPDPAVAMVDPSLQAQQAAMFMPVPVQAPLQTVSGGNAVVEPQSQTGSPVVASIMQDSSSAAGTGVRQPVAGDPAAFAAVVVSEARGASTQQPAQDANLSTRAPLLDTAKAASIPAGSAQPAQVQALDQSPQAGGRVTSAAEIKTAPAFDRVMAEKLPQTESAQSPVQPIPMPTTSGLMHPAGVQAASGSQPVSSIPQAVNHSAWGDMLGNRVVWMVSQQHQGVELHLNPPSLGPLEVRLSMSDGQANLSFSTQHLPVKEAIESAAPRLREMLGESGISLGSVSVNVGSFSQQQQQPQQSDQQAQTGAGRSLWPSASTAVETPVARTSTRVLGGNGMVDIFA